MLEQELRRALQAAKPEPPLDFDARSDAQLARLILEEKNMKKKLPALVVVTALALALGMATALAAGLLNWNRGLEESLQVTDSVKEQYEQTELVDFPQQSVTQNGVTVTLDQCIVDANAAYIAFRVSGYTPPKGVQPAFDRVEYRGEGIDVGGSGSFYDGLVSGPDGHALYAESGERYEGGYDLPYADKNGNLTYIISLILPDASLVGKKLNVTLGDLGTYQNKFGDVKVDVKGTWAFEWTLRGTDKGAEYQNMDAPIGDAGVKLNGVYLSPIRITMDMTLPRAPAAAGDPDDSNAPYLASMKMKDGTVYYAITDGGSEGYLDATGDAYRQTWALNRIITPDQVDSLLFVYPESEKEFEIKLGK